MLAVDFMINTTALVGIDPGILHASQAYYCILLAADVLVLISYLIVTMHCSKEQW